MDWHPFCLIVDTSTPWESTTDGLMFILVDCGQIYTVGVNNRWTDVHSGGLWTHPHHGNQQQMGVWIYLYHGNHGNHVVKGNLCTDTCPGVGRWIHTMGINNWWIDVHPGEWWIHSHRGNQQLIGVWTFCTPLPLPSHNRGSCWTSVCTSLYLSPFLFQLMNVTSICRLLCLFCLTTCPFPIKVVKYSGFLKLLIEKGKGK